jgi:hypothetical protein
MSGRGRGRKSQKKLEENVAIATIDATISNIAENVDENGEKQITTIVGAVTTKTRNSRKKQFPVIALVTPDGIEGSLVAEHRKPLIAHLPIVSSDVTFYDLPKYDPSPDAMKDPVPYDYTDNIFTNAQDHLTFGEFKSYDNKENISNNNELATLELDNMNFSNYNTINNTINDTINNNVNNVTFGHSNANGTAVTASTSNAITVAGNNVKQNDSINFYRKGTLLLAYKNSSELKEIPSSTTVACFWDCHPFHGKPCVMPIRDHGDHIEVDGNYCSPECMVAHLFDMPIDMHARWERMSLIHRIYSIDYGTNIVPASNRNVLTLFGGLLSIEQYRALLQSHKVRIDVHYPPMISILATMDTKPIDFYDTYMNKNSLDTNKERLQKAEEQLKLRRSKPLKAFESTLDAYINLKIH